MPLTLTWHDIALRLALSVAAGALIGLDRGELQNLVEGRVGAGRLCIVEHERHHVLPRALISARLNS